MNRELRRIYHLKTANYLEKIIVKEISDNNLVDVANHYVNGGASEKAFDYLIRLGENALNVFANRQSIDYLTEALKATEKNFNLATSENLYKIHSLRSRAWMMQEETPFYVQNPQAIRDRNKMLQLATIIGDQNQIASAYVALSWTFNPNVASGSDKRMQHLKKGLELFQKIGNKSNEGHTLFLIGVMLTGRRDTLDESIRWLEEAVKKSREADDYITESNSTRLIGTYYSWKGEYNRAKEYFARAISLIEEKGLGRWQRGSYDITFCYWLLCQVLARLGEYNDAISTGQRGLKLTRQYEYESFETKILNTFGWIYHNLQNIELAIQYNNESLECEYQRSPSKEAIPIILSNLGWNYLSKNDYEKAEKYFDEAWEKRHLHSLIKHIKGEDEEIHLEATLFPRVIMRILLGKAEVSLAKEDYEDALKKVKESIAISEKVDLFKNYIVKGLKLKAETLAKMGKLNKAIEQMEKALNLAQQLGTPHLLWQMHYSYGLLLDMCGNHREAEEQFAEALNLIEMTASKLDDPSLAKTLLNALMTKAIRDAYSKSIRIETKHT
jgi:tetratricopeptide (TPR) repeat protein